MNYSAETFAARQLTTSSTSTWFTSRRSKPPKDSSGTPPSCSAQVAFSSHTVPSGRTGWYHPKAMSTSTACSDPKTQGGASRIYWPWKSSPVIFASTLCANTPCHRTTAASSGKKFDPSNSYLSFTPTSRPCSPNPSHLHHTPFFPSYFFLYFLFNPFTSHKYPLNSAICHLQRKRVRNKYLTLKKETRNFRAKDDVKNPQFKQTAELK